MLFIVLNLLVAAVAAQQIAYFPPPNSVDDYIRVDISDDNSPITEVTIAAWAKKATPTSASHWDDGYFFSYSTRGQVDNDNTLLLGGNHRSNGNCIKCYVSGKKKRSSPCSKYGVTAGTLYTIHAFQCFTLN